MFDKRAAYNGRTLAFVVVHVHLVGCVHDSGTGRHLDILLDDLLLYLRSAEQDGRPDHAANEHMVVPDPFHDSRDGSLSERGRHRQARDRLPVLNQLHGIHCAVTEEEEERALVDFVLARAGGEARTAEVCYQAAVWWGDFEIWEKVVEVCAGPLGLAGVRDEAMLVAVELFGFERPVRVRLRIPLSKSSLCG